MKSVKRSFIIFALLIFAFSCSDNEKGKVYDGRLDTDIIRISARSAGTIERITVVEGQQVQKGQLLAQIDTLKAHIQLLRQQAQLQEIAANRRVLEAQIKQARAQLDFSKRTLEKTRNMVARGAATDQKLDELQTQVQVQQARLQGLLSNVKLLQAKKSQIEAAIALTRVNIKDGQLVSPINGVVLNKIKVQSEWAAPGMPVLELADLSRLEATIYVSLLDLDDIKLEQKVELSIDGSDKTFEGRIKWISSEAEFTPKTILTEETRNSLVYAVKIDVPNPDHKLKIGMPVQVRL